MTSSPDRRRREDEALLKEAAAKLRADSRRRQANGADVPGWVWAACALMDECQWAVGRGTLDSPVRASAVELARRIVADTGGS